MNNANRSGLVHPNTLEQLEGAGWTLDLTLPDGTDLTGVKVSNLWLRNEGMGIGVEYGQRPEGYDGIVISSPGGGGSVIVPYTWIGDSYKPRLYIGMLEQKRVLQGDTVLNLPRGFLDRGETHLETAKREGSEELTEAGVDAVLTEIFELPGAPCNPDSAFFNTSAEGDGVQYFAVNINQRMLGIDPNARDFLLRLDIDSSNYLFRKGRVYASTKAGEGILGCRFIPWQEAMKVSDQFTICGVARLISKMDER